MEIISRFREYIRYTTASSVYEARLAYEEFGSKAHTYSPAYTDTDFPVIMQCSSHITFNSFSQFRRFYSMVKASGEKISCGIRINPEYSEVEVELYNPCAPGTRFGVTADLLPETLPRVSKASIVIVIVNPVLMNWNILCST